MTLRPFQNDQILNYFLDFNPLNASFNIWIIKYLLKNSQKTKYFPYNISYGDGALVVVDMSKISNQIYLITLLFFVQSLLLLLDIFVDKNALFTFTEITFLISLPLQYKTVYLMSAFHFEEKK